MFNRQSILAPRLDKLVNSNLSSFDADHTLGIYPRDDALRKLFPNIGNLTWGFGVQFSFGAHSNDKINSIGLCDLTSKIVNCWMEALDSKLRTFHD